MPKRLTTKDGEAREITRKTMAGMRPMQEVAPELVERFKKEKRARGRPAGRTKAVVSISIDQDVLEMLRASGSGWQSRVNALLRAATGLQG